MSRHTPLHPLSPAGVYTFMWRGLPRALHLSVGTANTAMSRRLQPHAFDRLQSLFSSRTEREREKERERERERDRERETESESERDLLVSSSTLCQVNTSCLSCYPRELRSHSFIKSFIQRGE